MGTMARVFASVSGRLNHRETLSRRLSARGSFFCLRKKPFPRSPDKSIGEVDACRLHSIAINGNRLFALASHNGSITIDLNLHILRLTECSGAAFLNVAEKIELA